MHIITAIITAPGPGGGKIRCSIKRVCYSVVRQATDFFLTGKKKAGRSMNIYQELKARGFIYQETDSAAIEKNLNTGNVTFYVGFDPTGNSLHVGHLLPVMAMRLLQKAGHIPVVLVGGATAQIGDPSGRSTARNMLSKEMVAENAECLRQQLARFITLENGKAHFVNNNDWFKDLQLLDFLRDIGSRFSVNRMLAQESVKQRLENGLSYLEFPILSCRGMTFIT